MRKRRRLLATLAVGALIASCTAPPEPATSTAGSSTTSSRVTTTLPETTTTSSTTTTTTAPPPEGDGVAYFFFQGYPVEPGPYLVPVSRTGADTLEGALAALLAGVDAGEAEGGLSSTIPAGTRLLGVDLEGGVASVDLSREFESGGGSLSILGRVAQIVYTATRFDGVEGVEFLIDGVPIEVLGGEGLIIDEPQTREGYVDLVPAILVESPAWGATAGTPVRLSGTARTESGRFGYVFIDADGDIVSEGELEAGAFDTEVELVAPVTAGSGSLVVFEVDPTGAQIHVLQYPLHMAP